MNILLIAAVPGLVALLLWAVLDLEKFVLFIVLGSAVFPASLIKVGGNNIAAVDILIVIVVIAWVVANAMGHANDAIVRRNQLLYAATLFVGWNTITIAWSVSPGHTLAFSIQLVELLIVCPLVFGSLPTSLGGVRSALRVFTVLTCALSVMALVTIAVSPSAKTTAEFLPGFNKNALGSFVGAGMVMAYALLIGARQRSGRLIMLAAMVIDLGGLAAANSRGAVLGTGVGLLAVGMLLRYRRLLAIAMAIGLGAIYIVVVQPDHTLGRSQQLGGGGYDSSVIRKYAWEGAITKIENRPWFGTGGQTYIDRLPHFVDYITQDPLNLFLLTWAEDGIPGLLALGFLLFAFLSLLWRCRRLPRETAALAVGAGGVAIDAIVHFQVDVAWSRGESTIEFIMMGVMMAVWRLTAEQREPAGRDLDLVGASPPGPVLPDLAEPGLVRGATV